MSNQTKIIIGILAVVVLFGGFLLWKNYQPAGNILIQTDKTEYQPGDTLKVKIKNSLRKNISFSSCYPYYLERKNEKWESYKYAECQKLNGNGHYIAPGQEKAFEIVLPETIDGLHRLAIPLCIDCKNDNFFREDKWLYSNEFLIKEKIENGDINNNTPKTCDLECDKYHYSICPEGCVKECIGSCPVCEDCDGSGSCTCP